MQNLTLLTDLYQLTMAYGYWKNGMYDKESVFHLFFRKYPFRGNYVISCGLEQVVDYLNNIRFTVEDVQYLGSLQGNDGKPLFSESFLNYLQRFEFKCDVDAVPEGMIVHPHQPLLRIKGPLLQAQLVETALLNIVNFSSLIATKAARIKQAAQGDAVLEFGLRRAQGPNGALSASRASYIGGCDATSNVLAGKVYDIPVKGTHAHSWIMCHDSELNAFQSYMNAMPGNSVLLVDTYDTIQGVHHAIQVAQDERRYGRKLHGIRLDSGDLSDLSIKARQILDNNGFHDTQIVASNDLDEYRIQELKSQGAKITIWGVGTRLSTAYDQPALGGVYKLAAIKDKDENWDYKVKLSETAVKVSNPGYLNVKRYLSDGKPCFDKMVNEWEEESPILVDYHGDEMEVKGESFNLLKSIFKRGELVYNSPSIHDMRSKTLMSLENYNAKEFVHGLDKNLLTLKNKLIKEHKTQ